jgi:hypothetical protein
MMEPRHCVTVKFFIDSWREESPADTAELLSGCLGEDNYDHSVLSYEEEVE